MAKKTILFVDDEIYGDGSLESESKDSGYMAYYVQSLRDAGYSVDVASSVEEVDCLIRQGLLKYDLVILDIMMPYGVLDSQRTQNGLATGILLAKIIGETSTTPICVLSNTIDSSGSSFASMKEIGDFATRIWSKLSTSPTELVGEIAHLI